MVILDFKGRLGNALFELSEAIYIANLKNTELRILHRADTSLEEIYGREFIGNYKLIEEEEFDRSKFKKLKRRNGVSNDGKIDESSIANTKNVIIEDYFLGRSYVHDELIRDIFVPSESLREEILELYAPTRNSLSMHIRRGDFLWSTYTKRGWHSCTKEYWETAYTLTGKEYNKVFILSDDLDWCKNTLNIPGNVIYVDKETENFKLFFDLFLPSFCGDNIISASTFSWWMQHLNYNPTKTVIMPYPWNTVDMTLGERRYYTDNCIKLGIYDYKLK